MTKTAPTPGDEAYRRVPSPWKLFLREFLRAPSQVGAVAPSSRRLAAAMVEPIPRAGAPVVVELGPGTGAFTRQINERLAGRGRQLAIEVNPVLATRLARQHREVEVVTADAQRLPELLSARGIADADVVVSGLPWAAFDSDTQKALLDAVCTIMRADGVFVTFAYGVSSWTPPARRMRQLLQCPIRRGRDRANDTAEPSACLRLLRPTARVQD